MSSPTFNGCRQQLDMGSILTDLVTFALVVLQAAAQENALLVNHMAVTKRQHLWCVQAMPC